MSDAQTIAAYNKEADRYAELAKTDPAQEGLTSFLELVPIGGLVLDLGCGPGHTAALTPLLRLPPLRFGRSLTLLRQASRRSSVLLMI